MIDNIFTNELHLNITSGILFNDISDHLPIFALCEFNVTRRIVNGFQYVKTVNEDTLAYINKKPWLTNGFKRACAKTKKLYKAFILSRSAESEHKYKTFKNKLTSILRLTEKTYYSTLLEQQRKNVKGTWKILNKVINKKYNKPTYPEYFLKNDKRISKKEDIANGFNYFFLQMLVHIWQKISHYLTKMFRFMITWKEK